LIQNPCKSDAQFGKNLANLSRPIAASANRRFKFQKRRQLFIRTHNETPSVAAMRAKQRDRHARTQVQQLA
jgi:hypothetical protein